jgi:hypothetical protein
MQEHLYRHCLAGEHIEYLLSKVSRALGVEAQARDKEARCTRYLLRLGKIKGYNYNVLV